ncbi:nuclear transport factor 2 family protein [Mucilaginibacter sp. ZT4R22]|uniref:Nuclear transport factor 2 family protein n=1 Tax=Mucilaginibacter pankratovii TaxID=2772110 RepID=A0ABR7WKC2_9SPHI|nr:nuclear transport factor 2 family protein [Mucilaginibacter pankratovii]MBD1362616.1 nuclear transport factor 2 family protein [Mucilaginibacter pankratovii]
MSTINEKLAAEQVLQGYAEVLNKANISLISSFYTFDGLFIPHGYKSLTKKELDVAGGKLLKAKDFRINFDIENVTIGNEFAFIDATAQTTTIGRGGEETREKSRDFFVLRKDGADWKIYRYLFNRVQN